MYRSVTLLFVLGLCGLALSIFPNTLVPTVALVGCQRATLDEQGTYPVCRTNAVFQLTQAQGQMLLTLRAREPHTGSAAPLQARIRVQEQLSSPFTISTSWRVYTLLLPPGEQDRSEVVVALSQSGTNKKNLNVAVSTVSIVQVPGRTQSYVALQPIEAIVLATLLLVGVVFRSGLHARMSLLVLGVSIFLMVLISYQVYANIFLVNWRVLLGSIFAAVLLFHIIGPHTDLKNSIIKHSNLLTPFFLLCCLCSITIIYSQHYNSPPIRSDGVGYYIYLPAYLIYHDPSFHAVVNQQFGGHIPDWSGVVRFDETDRYLDKYGIGIAVLMLPGFVVGHLLTLFTDCKADGFSWCYQYPIALTSMFYVAVGLIVLKKTLALFFSAGVVLATLICIAFGTNLLHYATYDSVFSHGFSFCFFALLVYFTVLWYKEPSLRNSVVLAVSYAMLVLIRIPNALAVLFIMLFDIRQIQDIRARYVFLWEQRRNIALMICVFVLIMIPQLLVYKYTTGLWFINAYQQEGFNFISPHIFDVLFSVQKGLFFWSPLLLLSLVGIAFLRQRQRAFMLPISVFMLINTYLIASWHHWQYGGSYGHRAFTDSLALMAVPMAAAYQSLRRRWAIVAVRAAVCVLVVLALVQMVQYWRGIIPFDGTTFELYARIFLRFDQ